MELVEIIIDGLEYRVERDRRLIDVLREIGISIPSLCYHAALTPYGACRLCVVEVDEGKRTWPATACDFPIREGLTIRTNTERVMKARKTALEFLWAECPDAEEIVRLAQEMGVDKPRFPFRNATGKCILCGLCVRACEQLVGTGAIGFAKRGAERNVDSPFGGRSEVCIGCQACVKICPTGHVETVDDGPIRRMTTWNTDLELAECETCGARFAPAKELEHVRSKLPDHITIPNVCPSCKRLRTAAGIGEASALYRESKV